MIYKHYKGGLYFLKGYATPFRKSLYDEKTQKIDIIAKAKYESTLEDVDVILVYDKGMGSTYYAYENNNIHGVMCFYRDLNGQYWLRPRDNFYEEVRIIDNDGVTVTPRFKKVNGENLFDIISDLLKNSNT